jgi:hypothetical protein
MAVMGGRVQPIVQKWDTTSASKGAKRIICLGFNAEGHPLLLVVESHKSIFFLGKVGPSAQQMAEVTKNLEKRGLKDIRALFADRGGRDLKEIRDNMYISYPKRPIDVLVAEKRKCSALGSIRSGITALSAAALSYAWIFTGLSIPWMIIATIINILAIYSGVLFFSQGIRIAYALTRHGGIRGPPIFTTPIAYVKDGTIIYHPAFENLVPRLKQAIQTHEKAHLEGKGEIRAYLNEIKVFLSLAKHVSKVKKARVNSKVGLREIEEAAKAKMGKDFRADKWNDEKETILSLYEASLRTGKVFGIKEFASGKSTVIFPALAYLINKHRGLPVFTVVSHNYFAYEHGMNAALLVSRQGKKVGYITQEGKSYIYKEGDFEECSRQELYARVDIIYGVISELNFDYQRELLSSYNSELAQSKRKWFICADEADKTLVEEIFSPHIISSAEEDTFLREKIQRVYRLAINIKDNRKLYTREDKTISLTSRGVDYIKKEINISGSDVELISYLVEQALMALICFEKNVNYFIEDNQAVIIGESGEPLIGRRYRDYLHIFIELKEGLPFKGEGRVQSQMFLLNYLGSQHIAGFIGLTGSLEEELVREIYPDAEIIKLDTASASGEKEDLPTEIKYTREDKLYRVKEFVISEFSKAGARPVLINVGSLNEAVEAESLFRGLDVSVIDARNAYDFTEVARIVEDAGRPGRITIVTSVASRGIDFILKDEAKKKGILLIDANLSPSSLDSKQFRGRGARRPGEKAYYKAIYSLEDTIFTEYESLTEEARVVLKESRSGNKTEEIIRVIQRKILEQKIYSVRTQKRVWEYT